MSMKVAVSLPDSLFETAETIRKRLGMARSRFYANAIEAHVRTYRAGEIREALDEVYSTEPSGLERTLDELQAEALREEW